MENETTAASPMEDSSKPLAFVERLAEAKPKAIDEKAVAAKPKAMDEDLAAKLIKGVRLNVALAEVVHIHVVGTDFVLTLSSGAKLLVKDGALNAAAEPEFSLEFLDARLSGQDAMGQSQIASDVSLASSPWGDAISQPPQAEVPLPTPEKLAPEPLAVKPVAEPEPFFSLGMWSTIAGGVAALAGISSLSSPASQDAASPAAVPSTSTAGQQTTILGSVTAGPVVAQLFVQLFDASGKVLAVTLSDNSGNFSFNLADDFSGLVMVRVSSTNESSVDYVDELTGKGKDLNIGLRGFLSVKASQSNVIGITVVTELAVRKALLDAGLGQDATTPPTQEQATASYKAVGALFGVSDIGASVTTVISNSGGKNSAYNEADGLSEAEKYGQVLAKLSANDYNTGSVDATLKLYLGVLSNSSSGSQNIASDVNKLLQQGITTFKNSETPTTNYADLTTSDPASTRLILSPSV
jgi:hypothetical protein